MIDVNTASKKALRTVPVIGRQRAKYIHQKRPFSSWADFQTRVSSVGKATLKEIRKYCVIGAVQDEVTRYLQEQSDKHSKKSLKTHFEVNGNTGFFCMFLVRAIDDNGNGISAPLELEPYHANVTPRETYIRDIMCEIKIEYPKYWFIKFEEAIVGIDGMRMEPLTITPSAIGRIQATRSGTGFFCGERLLTANHGIDELTDGQIQISTIKDMLVKAESDLTNRAKLVCAKHGNQPDDVYIKFYIALRHKLQNLLEAASENNGKHIFPGINLRVYDTGKRCDPSISFKPEQSEVWFEASVLQSIPEQDILVLNPANYRAPLASRFPILRLESESDVQLFSSHLSDTTELRTYGYPEAIEVQQQDTTLMQSSYAKINDFKCFNNPTTWILKTSLDSFEGMSGSPVFWNHNDELIFVGMYVFGEKSSKEMTFAHTSRVFTVMQTGVVVWDPTLLAKMIACMKNPGNIRTISLQEVIAEPPSSRVPAVPTVGTKRKITTDDQSNKRKRT